MADQNPIDQALSGGANPIDSSLGGSAPASSSVASSSPNPIDAALGGGGSRPDNGNSTPDLGSTQPPADETWYQKAWRYANTPLTEDLGLPTERQGAGGFERAVEHIVSGLTSPLSIGLTAATFGTGGLIESAGANALKEAGLTATEIADATKASEVAVNAAKDLRPVEPAIQQALTAAGHDPELVIKARQALGDINLEDKFAEPSIQSALEKAGFSEDEVADLGKASDTIQKAKADFSPVEDAVRESGANVDNWKRAQDTLYQNGLTEHDLVGGNAMERGAFQIVRNVVPDLPIAAAARAAKTANSVLSAGFTLQQFQQAAAMSPRFLDALKEGDTDKAWEYGTEALVGSTLGVLGTTHALHAAGELFKPLLETDKFRPNDQWLAIDRANKEREALHSVADQQAINIHKSIRDTMGHEDPRPVLGDTPEVKAQKELENASVFHQIVTGGDTNKAATWYNALAEAAGKDDRVNAKTRTISLPNGLELRSKVDENSIIRTLHSPNPPSNLLLTNEDGIVGELVSEKQPDGTYAITHSYVDPDLRNQGLGTRMYEQVVADNQSAGHVLTSDWDVSDAAKKIWEGLVKRGQAEEFEDSKGRPRYRTMRPSNPVLPDNIAEQIKSSAFPKTSEAYQKTVLDSLARVAKGELSEKELAAAKLASDEQARNFEIGSNNDLLHNQIEDYMTRVYKDTNPEGKVIASNAKSGQFATNVTMARQRVYDSHLTALLKSPKEMDLDPATNVAQGRAELIKAGANKQLIDNLRDKFTRASDGRPAVVLSGSGQIVAGANGEDPVTMIQPDRVRKIQVADDAVQAMTKSGDLQRFLDEGSLRDITPKIYFDKIPQAIAKLEEQNISQPIKFDEEGNSLNRKNIQLLKDIQSGKRPVADLKEYNDSLKPMYAWDPQDYINLKSGAMKGWNFVTNDTAGNGVVVRSDIRVHPEFAEYLQNRLGLEESALQKNPISKAALGLGTKAKELLLSMSPFHMAQLALRGVMIGINPFTLETPDILGGERVDPTDPNSPSIIRKGVENGLTTGTDYKALQEHSEGVSTGGGIVRKIPGVGPTIANSLDWYQNFLFKRFMPALKANSMEKLFRDYQSAHPDWSVDKTAKAAALHTNDTFGGINWKAMGRSATTQDWGRMLLLAPDWLESEMRSMARLFNKDDGGLGRAQVAKMSMAMWGIARVLNYASTGNAHYEAPFGLAVKNKEGKETMYSIRTLPTDLLHAAADPVNFLKGRLSPGVGLGVELTTSRDRYGRKLAPQDLWADVFRNMAPIPFQSIGQAISGSGPQVSNAAQVWKAAGGTATNYQTPAQKMAADLAATHSEDGAIDPAQQARHRMVMDFEDKVRAGDMSWPDLTKLTYQTDQLKESEYKKIQENLKKTKGMDSSMASLYTRASRLPAAEYLQLYDQMNSTERAAMVPLTLSVQKKYLNKAKKDMTPAERAADPTFRRLLNMIPNNQPGPAEPGPQSSVTQPSGTPPPPANFAPPVGTQAALDFMHTATHGETGHQIGSHDGVNWFDRQTGAPFNG